MRSLLCMDLLICAIVLLMAWPRFTRAEMEQIKNRRGGGGGSATTGLYAYPRVGRSDPSMAGNNVHEAELSALDAMYAAASLEDYEEYPKSEIKRLVAYPRVGRSDAEMRKWARWMALQQALDKRTGPSATSGLWFGPRLGKRSVDAHPAHEPTQKEHY